MNERKDKERGEMSISMLPNGFNWKLDIWSFRFDFFFLLLFSFWLIKFLRCFSISWNEWFFSNSLDKQAVLSTLFVLFLFWIKQVVLFVRKQDVSWDLLLLVLWSLPNFLILQNGQSEMQESTWGRVDSTGCGGNERY